MGAVDRSRCDLSRLVAWQFTEHSVVPLDTVSLLAKEATNHVTRHWAKVLLSLGLIVGVSIADFHVLHRLGVKASGLVVPIAAYVLLFSALAVAVQMGWIRCTNKRHATRMIVRLSVFAIFGMMLAVIPFAILAYISSALRPFINLWISQYLT